MRTLCQFTFLLRWNVASSLKITCGRKVSSSMFWSIQSQNLTLSFVVCAKSLYQLYVVWLEHILNIGHARQLVAVFQVLCLLYRLTCMGYRQNSLRFVSCSPLIHAVSWGFCLYRNSLFAEIGDSNDKRSSSLEVQC